MLWFNEGFTFRNFLVDAITIFVFIVTIWLLFTVFMDLFHQDAVCCHLEEVRSTA